MGKAEGLATEELKDIHGDTPDEDVFGDAIPPTLAEKAEETALDDALDDKLGGTGEWALEPVEETVKPPADELPAGGKETPPDQGSVAPDAALVERAHKAGLSDDEIGSVGTADALTRVVGFMEKRAGAAPPPETVKPEALDEAFARLEQVADEDSLLVLKAIRQENASVRASLATMQEQQTRQEEQQTRQEAVAAREFLDGRFIALEKDFEEVFGKGKGVTMDQKSEPFQNRLAVLDKMNVLAAGYVGTGKSLPPNEALFDEAVKASLSDKLQGVRDKKVADKIRRLRGATAPRPTSREMRAENLSPEQRARANVAAKMRDWGGVGREAADDFLE